MISSVNKNKKLLRIRVKAVEHVLDPPSADYASSSNRAGATS